MSMLLVLAALGHSVNAERGFVVREKSPSELSLCELSKRIKLHQNKVVRIRAAILGMGGHYPFFITAAGCKPDEVILLRVEFHNRTRTEAQLQKRIDDVLSFNQRGNSPRAEAVLVGRIRKERCHGCAESNLKITLMDVESKIPEAISGK